MNRLKGTVHLFNKMYLPGPEREKRICELRRIFYSDKYDNEIAEACSELEAFEKMGIKSVCYFEEAFPKNLLNIYKPPLILYYIGSIQLPEGRNIAVVGSRDASPYGKKYAYEFSRYFSENNFGVISGMARGVDSFALSAAVLKDHTAFAVLACGVDVVYPRENNGLYKELCAHGTLISEYPPGTKPIPAYFPWRNRIISGLSDAILVVEAKSRSGSLITADFGLDQGKDIYVLPGRIDDECSAGCLELIEKGASPAISPAQVLRGIQTLRL